MSKSEPETMIDPLDMIAKYGADALRLSMIVGQSPGNDSRLYEEKIAGYRNFVNKLWNASRFVLLQCEQAKIDPRAISGKREAGSDKKLSLADRALLHSLQALIEDVTKGLEQYGLSETGERLYSFVWDYFCDWYLELSKGSANVAVLVHALRTILQLLHPYCPFVTEEIWSFIKPEKAGDLIKEPWPMVDDRLCDQEAFRELQVIIDVITAIRKLRIDQEVEASTKVAIIVFSPKHAELLEGQKDSIIRLAKLSELTIEKKPKKIENAATAFLTNIEIHLPLAGLIDIVKVRSALEKERGELRDFLAKIEMKLSDETFVQKAPEKVVAAEREKAEVTREKLMKIEERLRSLT